MVGYDLYSFHCSVKTDTTSFHQAAELASAVGRAEETVEWAKRALALTETCAGSDSPDFELCQLAVRRIEARWNPS